MKLPVLAAVVGLSVAVAMPTAQANLVVNGSFETTTFAGNSQIGGTYGQGLSGWTGSGFNLLFMGGQFTSSAANQYNDPGNKLNPNVPASPDGGSIVALDGDTTIHGALTQTLTGLAVGTNYAVSFDWAAAQLANRNSQTTEQLVVDFGDAPTQATPIVTNPAQGFTGWFTQSFIFRADSANAVLSFLSDGTPNGQPPIALLDGVAVNAVSEPSTLAPWLLAAVATASVVGLRRRRG